MISLASQYDTRSKHNIFTFYPATFLCYLFFESCPIFRILPQQWRIHLNPLLVVFISRIRYQFLWGSMRALSIQVLEDSLIHLRMTIFHFHFQFLQLSRQLLGIHTILSRLRHKLFMIRMPGMGVQSTKSISKLNHFGPLVARNPQVASDSNT